MVFLSLLVHCSVRSRLSATNFKHSQSHNRRCIEFYCIVSLFTGNRLKTLVSLTVISSSLKLCKKAIGKIMAVCFFPLHSSPLPNARETSQNAD